MTVLAPTPNTLTGKHVLIAMLCFFLVVIAVNAGFIVMAVRSFPGEDERRSYLQGLHYNKTLASRAAQARLGWVAETQISRGASGVIVTFRAQDARGAPLEGLNIQGALRRPATTRHDQALTFQEVRPGLYEARARTIDDGAWIIQGEAKRGADTMTFERRVSWSRALQR